MDSEFKFFILTTYEKKYAIQKHSHPCYELVYYMNGKGITSISDKTYHFTSNTFTLTRPDESHDESADQETSIMFIGFTTNYEFSSGIYTDLHGEVLQTMLEIDKEMKNKQPLYQSILNVLTEKLLLHILRLYPKKNFHESNFEYILNYINSNANKNISVQQIAYNLGYNYDYLRQLFVKQMGQTLKSYIMELKIDKVKTYLLTTEYTLDKIAEITGFSSASHMCMTFKKDTGLSPMEFRENDLQKDRRDNLRKFV